MEPIRIGVLSPSGGWMVPVLEGLGLWAQSRPDVVLGQFVADENGARLAVDWEIRGALLFAAAAAAPTLRETGLPVVNLSNSVPDLPFPQVILDDRAVGRIAAEHFLDRGHTRLIYLQGGRPPHARLRWEGFRERLAEAGLEPVRHNVADLPRHREAFGEALGQWLRKPRKPVAVFAMSDTTAATVVRYCRMNGLRVPEDVSVLGVDNDRPVCTLCAPPISSVRRPGRAIAFAAGDLLMDLMAGREPPAAPLLLPPLGVAVRRSTEALAVEHPELAQALEFIRSRATTGITVRGVLDQVPVSRRQLERMFRQTLGRTPLEEIHRVQIKAAKRLLAETRLTVQAIAERLGFRDSPALSRRFKRLTGRTPTEYRKQFAAAP